MSHQAAKVGLGVDFGDVTGYVEANDLGTAVLLEALWRRSFRGSLVLASSMVVYGEGLARCPRHGLVTPGSRRPDQLAGGHYDSPCSQPGCPHAVTWVSVDEDAELRLRNVYGATKLHQEQLCSLWGRDAGAVVVALRYHNVYGPRMPTDTPYAGVASIFRSALAAGRAPLVFEDGRQTRDFVHVAEVARANMLSVTGEAVSSGAYNIGSGTPHTVAEMAGALADAVGPPAGCTRINRPTVRTIYPPVAESWFAAVYRVGGAGPRHKLWQTAGLLADLTTVGLLVAALRRWGRDERWLALYALCPAPIFEFVNNAHVDGLAVTFVVASLVVAAVPRHRDPLRVGPPSRVEMPLVRRPSTGRDVAVGLLVGAAVLVKLYPAVLLVSLIGLPRIRPWLSAARSTVAAAALAVVVYLPHVVVVGIRVVGYLPGYLKEEHYDTGGRFLLSRAIGLSGPPAGALALMALAAAVTWVLWRRPTMPQAAVVLVAVLFLVTTPVQPWYPVSLLAVALVAGWLWPLAVVVAGYPYFFAVILDYHHTVGLGQVSYGVALAIALTAWATRRRIVKRHLRGPDRLLLDPMRPLEPSAAPA